VRDDAGKAMAYTKLHEKAKARTYYQKVLASNANQKTRDEARKKLAELK
jgi:hypothetical protein